MSKLRGRLSLLSDLGARITSSLNLPSVLQAVVDGACQLTNARYGALGVFDESGTPRQFVTHGLTDKQRRKIGEPPRGLGLLGWLNEIQRPIRLADVTGHPRSTGFPPNHPAMKSFLGVPIRHSDEALGNLYLTEKEGGDEFTPEDEETLAVFAHQAALAIRNANRFEGEQRAHAQAEAARRSLETLVRTSPVGVSVIEAGSEKVLLINREAERILGVSREPGDHLERYEQTAVRESPDGHALLPDELPIRRALVNGETVRAEEIRFRFPDDRAVPTLVNATPIYEDGDRISAAVAVIQDITPLEELESLRSEFLGVVSHELKTPLTAIKGSAAIALDSEREPSLEETRELFEIIDEQSDRLRDLIDNLLDITRIEAGSLTVQPESVDIADIVRDAVSVFSRGGAGQSIEVDIPDDPPRVQADRRRLVQVLSNLLNNASKFAPDRSEIAIEIRPGDDQVTVSVRDQGRGIARDKLPYLFKKFAQVHDDAQSRLGGSGLGLAISRGLIEAQGGRIRADSEGEGRGATFSFTLPLASGEAADPLTDVTRRGALKGSISRASERTRILAVDDDPRVLRLVKRVLGEAGYEATLTTDPLEVVGIVEVEEPDLILLDLNLGATSGLELLKRIREFSGVPAIFLTASDRTEDTVAALKLGADDYITKPFSPSELLARIEATLRRRALPDTMEARPPFVVEDLTINFAERRVTVGGRPVALSATEYKLLYEMATHAGLVLTHDQILQRIWGPTYSGSTELVRSVVRNVRRKLGDDARNPRFIFTEPQVGYRAAKP